jgi:osmoprotectant transport system substrate-binding protein
MRTVLRATWVPVTCIGLAVLAAACTQSPSTPGATPGPDITIGSLDSPEDLTVANLYAGVLVHAGARVTLRADLGSRSAVALALAAGQIDLYPDYAGTLLTFLDGSAGAAADQAPTAVATLRSLLAPHGATVLDPAPALDTDVFAVTHETASQDHLTTLSSLGPVAGQLILGGPPDCPQLSTCLGGLQNTYGLHFKSFVSLDDAGPVTVAALQQGEVQIAELNSSDGTIVENDFVPLTDDRHVLAADYVTPVIRKSVDTPAVAAALDNLSLRLTTDELAGLNIEVSVDHESPATAAQQWLRQNRLA